MGFRVDAGPGVSVGSVDVEVYPVATDVWDINPAPRVGGFRLEGPGPHYFTSDTVPAAEAVLRVTAPGMGVSFVHVKRAVGDVPALGLAPPGDVLPGSVSDGDGSPVVGARIQILGGGRRGVPLLERTTDREGRFFIDGVSSTVSTVLVRVLARGFAVAERSVRLKTLDGVAHDVVDTAIELERVEPIQGRVVIDRRLSAEDLSLTDWTVRVLRVPGVVAPVAADGTFRLDHMLGPPKIATLVLADIDEGLTHRPVRAAVGDRDVEIQIEPAHQLAGRVVNMHNGAGIGGCSVFHTEASNGTEVVQTDANGNFLLRRVPEGSIRVYAEFTIRPEEKRKTADTVEGSGANSDDVESLRMLLDRPAGVIRSSGSTQVLMGPEGPNVNPVVIELS